MKRFVLVLLLAAPLLAQETPTPPTLTEVQKLNVQLRLKELENAQLRLQLASDAFTRAKLEAEDVLSSLQKPGWRLDLQKLEYVPNPKEVAK